MSLWEGEKVTGGLQLYRVYVEWYKQTKIFKLVWWDDYSIVQTGNLAFTMQ